MPPKQENEPAKKEKEGKKSIPKSKVICGIVGPGPKYKLRSVVGYQEHCLSRFRNPAYTFGRRQNTIDIREGPGPKYLIVGRKPDGFTFGYAAKTIDTTCGPGPKYLIPSPKRPAFSIRHRTNYRSTGVSPGPYYIKTATSGPAFTIGLRATGVRCEGGPGPGVAVKLDTVKPRAPMFSIGYQQTGGLVCDGPGPKYNPKPDKPTPVFSFGMKHSECAPPYIVECDDKC